MSPATARGLLAALGLLLLGACATVAPPTQREDGGAAWQRHRQLLATIQTFSLQGRAAGGGGVKADLRWKQEADGRFDVRLAGPFGAGALAIHGNDREVEIRSKDGIDVTDDPEAWLYVRAGWTVPIRGLRWWALGLPAPGAPARTRFDEDGRLARLEQDGWTFLYLEYQDAQGFALPRRIEAANDRITLKLIVDRWDGLPPAAAAESPKS